MVVRLASAALVALAACGAGHREAPTPVQNTAPVTALPVEREPGTVRVVQHAKNGGMLELHGDRDEALAVAKRVITEHCGPESTIFQDSMQMVDERRGADGKLEPVMARIVQYVCFANAPK